jgi:hypothetical protein
LETVLNLVWLIVSVVLMTVFGVHAAQGGKDCSRGMTAIALVCLICLLFPVISMTDDLYSGPALLEPNKLKKLVQSAHAVLTLLPWNVLQAPQENNWAALDRQPDVRLPLQRVFSFSLSRRPPPAQSRLVLS